MESALTLFVSFPENIILTLLLIPSNNFQTQRQATSPQDHGASDGSGANNSAGIDSNNSISHSIPSEEQVDDEEEEPRLLS